MSERMLDKKSMLAKEDYDIANAIINTLLNAMDIAKSSNYKEILC